MIKNNCERLFRSIIQCSRHNSNNSNSNTTTLLSQSIYITTTTYCKSFCSTNTNTNTDLHINTNKIKKIKQDIEKDKQQRKHQKDANSEDASNKLPLSTQNLIEKIRVTFGGLEFKKTPSLRKAFTPNIKMGNSNIFISGHEDSLGHRIITLAITKYLYQRFPFMMEIYAKPIVKFFSSPVVFSNFFQYLNLHKHIIIQDVIPAHKYQKLYNITFLSLISAIARDSGEKEIEEKIVPLIFNYLDNLSKEDFESIHQLSKDYLIETMKINYLRQELIEKKKQGISQEAATQQHQEDQEEDLDDELDVNEQEDDEEVLNQLQTKHFAALESKKKQFEQSNIYPGQKDIESKLIQDLTNYQTKMGLGKIVIPDSNIPHWFNILVLESVGKIDTFARLQNLLSIYKQKSAHFELIHEVLRGTPNSLFVTAIYNTGSDSKYNILGYGVGRNIFESRKHAANDALLRTIYYSGSQK
ncbi:hypothetical protein CYY_008042 [Polysphondylium violaceum]|uniref:RNase III domain-containing protein n=1 Tax=Polysphondylium violaceum TaxID=133409 RepID=A0A8J4UXL9_9MYCE|nr:hypothetical protein CYY_008042 [Polysphondylium violaceum]